MVAFAQRYADAVVSAQQVADWRTRNDKPAPVVGPAR
jgi:hypothetical protein